jgi:hypothetical protein
VSGQQAWAKYERHQDDSDCYPNRELVAKGVERVDDGDGKEGDKPKDGDNCRHDGGRGPKLLHEEPHFTGWKMRTDNTSHAPYGPRSRARGPCCWLEASRHASRRTGGERRENERAARKLLLVPTRERGNEIGKFNSRL